MEPAAAAAHEDRWPQRLQEGAHELGISLPPGTAEQFGLYTEEVLRWRARMNLTGFRSARSILRDGILDSLACLAAIPPGPIRAIDIGSGAGFPGIPLGILRPDIALTLVESRRRRHSFLAHLCRTLEIANAECLLGRAEALAGRADLHATFDVAFARGVRRPEGAAALSWGFLRPAGLFLSQQKNVDPGGPARLKDYGMGAAFRYSVFGRSGAVIAYPRLVEPRFT